MCLYPKKIPVKDHGLMTVACGKCFECLVRRSNEWAYRCMQEAKQHKENCFLTLTYSDEFLPAGGNLCRSDLQKFIKRLRRAIEPIKIRIFYCGEYGSKRRRPHYHIIIFGWKPPDMRSYCFDNKGTQLYRSSFIETKWKFGFSTVGELTFETAKYCAKYLQKMRNDCDDLAPSFIGMSNRRGIGYSAIKPEILTQNGIYYNGKSISIPRYYIKVLDESHDLTEWKEKRLRLAHQYEFSQGGALAMREKLIKRRKFWNEKFLKKGLTK